MDEQEIKYNKEAFFLLTVIMLVMGLLAGVIIWFVWRPAFFISISVGLFTTVLFDLFISAVAEKRNITTTLFFYKLVKTIIATAWLTLCLFWAAIYAEIFRIIEFNDGVPLWVQVDLKVILAFSVGLLAFMGIGYFIRNIRLWW